MLSSVGGPAGYGSTPSSQDGYTTIDPDLVDVEIVQTPYGPYQGYDAPSDSQNPADWRNGLQIANATNGDKSADVATSTYTSNASASTSNQTQDYVESSQPWVLKITVRQSLGKWFGRNVDGTPDAAGTLVNSADPDNYSGMAG